MPTIHVLDHKTDQIIDFYSNKKKVFWDDEHVQNAETYLETFEFKTLYENSQYIKGRNRLIIPDEDGFFREFIINEALKFGEEVEVYSNASYLEDLQKAKPLAPFDLEGVTSQSATTTALKDTGWLPGNIDYAGIRTIRTDNHRSPYQALKTIANTFGLALSFRVETDGNKITGRYVDLIQKRGDWTGKEITSSKDLIGVTRRERTDELVTALVCLGPEREDGTRLVVEVKDEEARERWERNGHLWQIYEPQTTDEDMAESRLRSLGETELNKRVNAIVEYEADQVSIEEVFGLSHEKVRFRDVVRIKDTSYSPSLYLEAQVKEVRRSISDKSRKTYILGDFIEFEEEDLREIFNSMRAALAKRVTEQQLLDRTYTKVEIDDKDQGVYQDGTYYADQVSESAESRAKEHADQKAGDAEQNARDHAETVAGEAEQNAKDYAVAKAVYEAKVQELTEDIAGKAGLEYVDGELQLKADSSTVSALDSTVSDLSQTAANLQQTVSDHADELAAHDGRITTVTTDLNEVEGTLSATITNLSNLEGTVSQAQTDISANAQAIALKASQEDLDTVTDDVSSLSAELQVQAGRIDLKAEQSALETLEGDVTTVSNNLSSLTIEVDGISSDVSSLTQTVDGHSTEISSLESARIQHADLIADRVTKTEYATDQRGVVNRFENVESVQEQHAGLISSKVDATYVSGAIADIEVGGRNLAVGTDTENYTVWGNSSLSFDSDLNRKVIRSTRSSSATYWGIQQTNPSRLMKLIEDEVYTLSFKARGTPGLRFNYVYIMHVSTSNQSVNVGSVELVDDNFQTYKATFTKSFDSENSYVMISTGFGESGDWFEVKEIKVEKGNKATDWTPAPEDVQQQIDDANNVLSTHTTLIEQNQTAITQRATKTEVNAIEGRVSTAEGQISTMAGQIELKADSETVTALGSRVSSVEVDMDGLEGQISLKAEASVVEGLEERVGSAEITINGLESEIALKADRIELDGFVTAEEMEVRGDLVFGGELRGATGTFSGVVQSSKLIVNNPNIEQEGVGGIQLQVSQWQPNANQPYYKTGYIEFNTNNNALELIRYDLNGEPTPLDGFSINANRSIFEGEIHAEGALYARGGGSLKLQSRSLEDNAVSYMEFRNAVKRLGFIGHGSATNTDLFIENEVGTRIMLRNDVTISETLQVLGSETILPPQNRLIGSATGMGLARFEFWNSNQSTRWGRIGYLNGNDHILGIQNHMNADIRVYGDFSVSGSKAAVVDTESFGARKMYAIEATTNRFVDYIERTLSEGEHFIEINPMFQEVISSYFVIPHVQNASDVVILERHEDKFRVWVAGHRAEVVFEVNGARQGFENVYMEESTGPDSDDYEEDEAV